MKELIVFLLVAAAITALVGYAYYEYKLPEIEIARSNAQIAEAQSAAAQAQAAAWESVENTEEYLKFFTGPMASVMTLSAVCAGVLIVLIVVVIVTAAYTALTRGIG